MEYIIKNLNKTIFLGFSKESFNLIIRNGQSIFAKVRNDLIKEAIKKEKELAKASGKGFFSRLKIGFKTRMNFAEKYKEMTDGEIISQTPGNFVINNSEIKKIIVKEREYYNGPTDSEGYSNRLNYQNQGTDIKFITYSQKIKFHTSRQCKKEFKKAYGGLIKNF